MSALVERIIATRDRIKPLTRQGEDNVWRPAKDAVEVMADAANALSAIETASKAGKIALAAWDKYEPDISKDRVFDQAGDLAEALRAILESV